MESAIFSRSQAFRIGVSVESAVSIKSESAIQGGVGLVWSESGLSQLFPVGVSQVGVISRCSRPESAWSQLLVACTCGSGHTTQHGTPPPPPAHQHPQHGSGGAAPPPHQHPGTTPPSQIAKSPKEATPQEEGPSNEHGASGLWRPTSRRWQLLLANAH